MRSWFSINRHKTLCENAGSAWCRGRYNIPRQTPWFTDHTLGAAQTSASFFDVWMQSQSVASRLRECIASLVLFFWKQGVLLRHSNFAASSPTSLPQTILSIGQTSAFLSLAQLLLPLHSSPLTHVCFPKPTFLALTRWLPLFVRFL